MNPGGERLSGKPICGSRSRYTSLCMLAFACLASTPMPYLNTFWIFAIDMWLTLFVGAFAVPVLTGMMLDAVAERDRT